jgi:PAS domain S-box-containing protein
VVSPHGGAQLTILLLAVLLTAWVGGLLAGLWATVLAVFGAVLLPFAVVVPTPTSAPNLVVSLTVFAVVGASISALADRQRRQRMQLEDLRDQHARLAEVMHSIDIGHWYSDLATQQMHWDTQCKAHFGLPADAGVNLDVFIGCIHPEDRDRFQKGAERAIFGHTSCDIDFRVLLPGGGARWLKALGRGFYDRQGRPTRFDGITVDITRQKDAEAALSDAVRLKDDFLATISHELRTPLNAVLGWARMLSSGQVPPHRVDHAVTVIERNAQSQARLVEELLDLSRIESGQLRLHVEPVDAGAVVLGALEAVRPAAEARGVELVTSIEAHARWVSADADRLRQMTWNLLSNAVKFTPAGGRVTLSLAPVGPAIRLVVTDTGRGIRPEFLSRVFDRFSQADDSENRGIRGLGIGLAIVRELVEAHGGTIEASSEGEGLGARFTITLPGRLEVPALSRRTADSASA